MDTQDLIEVLAREVLKEIAKRENQSLSENIKHSPEKSIITAFLGNDEVLKDELKKETSVVDNIKLDSTWEEIEKSQSMLISLKLILEEIARNYPKNVQFRIRRYGK